MWKKSACGLEEEDGGVGMRVLARSMLLIGKGAQEPKCVRSPNDGYFKTK